MQLLVDWVSQLLGDWGLPQTFEPYVIALLVLLVAFVVAAVAAVYGGVFIFFEHE